jgi:hypothetical protein
MKAFSFMVEWGYAHSIENIGKNRRGSDCYGFRR